jgi:hypothetical protein
MGRRVTMRVPGSRASPASLGAAADISTSGAATDMRLESAPQLTLVASNAAQARAATARYRPGWMKVTIVPSGSRTIISVVEPPRTTVGGVRIWNPPAR